MLFLVLALVGTPLLAPSSARAQAAVAPSGAVQGIAAVVNDDIVTTRDLAERIRMTILFSNLPGDPQTQARVAPQVLRRVVDERLELQEAKRLGVKVDEAQIDAAIDRLAQSNNITQAQLLDYLARQGVPVDALRGQVRAELAWIAVLRQTVARRVVVTDEQVDLAIGADRAAQGTDEVRLSEILLPVYDPAQEAETLQNAEALVAELRGGADFASLARQFSVAASRDAGGDLGWVPAGSLSTALKPVVAGLAVDEVSKPVRTPTGVYVFKLNGRRAGADASVEPDAAALAAKRKELEDEQLQRLANRYLRDLRGDAFLDVRIGS
ncbi:MAG: peptidylprolyl isomerase [Geminicoccaceae bacterium]|nr:peptidylprolyl isomerase [Geminicoccaceae bacterium]